MYGNGVLNIIEVTQRSLVAIYTCFGLIFCLHLQGENVCKVVDISASTQRSKDRNVNDLYCGAVHLVDSIIITQATNALIVCHLFLNHFLKHFHCSYMFR